MAIFLNTVDTDHKGELFFADVLKNNLSDDYLCWHEVFIKSEKGGREKYPDFILFNPKHGFWILEVKDWSASYIIRHNPDKFYLRDGKELDSPYVQARRQMFALKNLLEKDKSCIKGNRLVTSFEKGVVFTNITRKEFEAHKLGNIPSDKVLCSDEINNPSSLAKLESRLLAMFTEGGRQVKPLTGKQIALVRHLIFPDLSIDAETSVQANGDQLKLIDYEQEKILHQIKLDSGAHALFGVAGSGKTIILLNKLRQLKDLGDYKILYLCRGTSVMKQVQAQAIKIGLPKNTIISFHQWCGRILKNNNILQTSKTNGPNDLIKAFKQGKIKSEGYDAILLDEGHDFKDKPEWLEVIGYMRKSPKSLFAIAYDEAQAIYGDKNATAFDFGFLKDTKTVFKHILRKNYRNTEQILLFAKVLAHTYLTDAEHDDIPKVRPLANGECGDLPKLFECASLDDELKTIASEILRFHENYKSWSAIAVLVHNADLEKQKKLISKIEQTLAGHNIPCSSSEDDFTKNKVKIMSVTKAKGLGFEMVCLASVASPDFGNPAREQEKSAAKQQKYLNEDDLRYLYIGATRALKTLVVTYTTPTEGTLSHRRVRALITALDKVRNSEISLRDSRG